MDFKKEATAREDLVETQENTPLPVTANKEDVDHFFQYLQGEAVASLTTCHVNLNASCDFHNTQKYKTYIRDWQQPAPIHCSKQRKKNSNAAHSYAIHTDRLGANMDSVCNT